MNTLKRAAVSVALLSAGMSVLLLIKNKAPKGFILWVPKLFAGAIAPFIGAAGLLSAVIGAITGAWLAVIAGLFSLRTTWNFFTSTVIQPNLGMYPRFDRAFGAQWEDRLSVNATPHQKNALLQLRWTWFAPADPQPCVQRDIPFWTDAASGRTLLCDVWLPPEGVPHTGLGMVYFHGSAWYLGDKDFGTRAFFRHLAAQGHVIMDAQYGLAPETDMFGMLADVKRAVAWFKEQAATYGIDAGRVVAGGASAGGQLALLAAYTPKDPQLTPADQDGKDLSLHAVVSYYGPCDLSACYYHTNQHLTPLQSIRPQPARSNSPNWISRLTAAFTKNPRQSREMSAKYANMAMAGRLEPVLGGSPEQAPERYSLASPITHVNPDCPPTFLAQGADDLIVPIEATGRLAEKLLAAGVPVINLVLPQVDHGFDLMLQRLSPPAQSALFELDRFLALL